MVIITLKRQEKTKKQKAATRQLIKDFSDCASRYIKEGILKKNDDFSRFVCEFLAEIEREIVEHDAEMFIKALKKIKEK